MMFSVFLVVRVCMPMHTYTNIHAHIEARGGLGLHFSGAIHLYFGDRVFH